MSKESAHAADNTMRRIHFPRLRALRRTVLPFRAAALSGSLAAYGAASRLAGPTSVLAVIVAVSAVFYAPHGLLPSLLLTVSLCLNFGVGLALSGADPVAGRPRKALLALGLAYNFATLAVFKDVDAVAALVAPSAGPLLGIGIPAGISFYTFHQAVFLVDAYGLEQRRRAVPRGRARRSWAGPGPSPATVPSWRSSPSW